MTHPNFSSFAAAITARALHLVAQSTDGAPLMTALHDLARDGTGASSSVLLVRNRHAAGYRVASATGLSELPLDPWLTTGSAADAAARASVSLAPLLLPALPKAVPELAGRLGVGTAVLAPVIGSDGLLGLLVLGFDAVEPSDLGAIEALADAFAVATERGRQRRESDLERDLRDALLAFERSGESPSALSASLASLCYSLAWLLGADAAQIWQHDRRTRELVLAAASDAAPLGTRASTSDEENAAVRGLRQQRAMLLRDPGQPDRSTSLTLTVPLRGRRRALGTLLLAGVRVEAGEEADLLARAEQIGRSLATSLENVQLLDDVLRSARRLAHTEKVLSLGQFVAGVAHELNNPLQGVLGHLELVRSSSTLTPALKRDLTVIHREATRAARIVRNLLVFAGSGRLLTRLVKLNRVVGRVLQLRDTALRRAGVEVTRELDPLLPLVKADGLLIQQAVLNVVLNAEQAMAGSGRLIVRTAFDGARSMVRLTVEDSGPGLPEDVRSRLFEPFFTTKDVGKGTGLGLAIAFGILRAHGGAIEADNHPGGGARFSLTLPVSTSSGTDRDGVATHD